MSKSASTFSPKVGFTRGDVDCGINLICQIIGTMIAVIGALNTVLTAPFRESLSESPTELAGLQTLVTQVIYGRVVAGMCVTMIFGNVYYALMAWRMMKRERRHDVTCLPYGINTPAAFAFVFSIVAKAAQAAADRGMHWEEGVTYAWRVGCVANMVAGAIATLCGLAGPYVIGIAPRVALLISIAGVGFTWLGINQVIMCFKAGYAGLLPLGLALVGFFGGVKTAPVPTAIVIMLVGAVMGWASQQGWPEGEHVKLGGTADAISRSLHEFGLYVPTLLDRESFAAIPEVVRDNMAIILPVSLTGAVNTLLSVYASHDAGDVYPIRECMVVEGVSTMVAGLFGSPLGTCVYFGHPQYKAQGGRICYSFFNALVFCALAMTGLFATANALLPPYAIAPIIIYVGLAINQDAFACTPNRQLPAAILGLFPPIADWVISLWPHAQDPPRELAAIAHGALMLSMLWTALGVQMIQRKFKHAAAWSLIAGLMSSIGLIHQADMDLSFASFRGSPGQFGTSCCAFFMGYSSLALAFGLLAIMQQRGWSQVPPPELEDEGESRGTAKLGHDTFERGAGQSQLAGALCAGHGGSHPGDEESSTDDSVGESGDAGPAGANV